MNGLRESLAEYLAVRRALGYKLEGTERLLGQFLDYLDAAGADRITVEHAVAWATRPAAGQHWHAMRLGAVRGFARYLHEVDQRVEVPAADLVPDRPRRAVPYLYTDEEILALVEAAGTLRSAHKTATFRTLFGLLIATGMRIGRRSPWTAPTSTPTLGRSSSATGSSTYVEIDISRTMLRVELCCGRLASRACRRRASRSVRHSSGRSEVLQERE
jgi:hypothetical protein